MNPLKNIIGMTLGVAVLALVAAGTGLFLSGGDGPFSYTTVHGQTVEIYGQGLYYYDSVIVGTGHQGADAVILLLGIPFLLFALRLYARGSLRGGMMLLGALAYFLYIFTNRALGGAFYNSLFFFYVAAFSLSFFAFVKLFTTIRLELLQSLPRRSMSNLMFVTGVMTAIVWAEAPLAALLSGNSPTLMEHYPTLFTHALDLAIMVPLFFYAGFLVLKRRPLGYMIALPLLIILASLAPTITAATVLQVRAGVTLTPAEIAGYIAGFVLLGVVATWMIVVFLRALHHRTQN